MNLLSTENENVMVTSGKVFLLEGEITAEDLEKAKKFYINPVEMREKDLSKLEQELLQFQTSVPMIESFVALKETMGLAMSQEDLDFVEQYFKEEEKRMPTETEIRVLDTYWSDHCRHTTFETELEEIVFPKGKFGEELQRVFNQYLANKQVTLMERSEEHT